MEMKSLERTCAHVWRRAQDSLREGPPKGFIIIALIFRPTNHFNNLSFVTLKSIKNLHY